MPRIHCWCGEVVEEGVRHYPGGDPEDGPAHKPQTEQEVREECIETIADRLMAAFEAHHDDAKALREAVIEVLDEEVM